MTSEVRLSKAPLELSRAAFRDFFGRFGDEKYFEDALADPGRTKNYSWGVSSEGRLSKAPSELSRAAPSGRMVPRGRLELPHPFEY